MGVLVYRPKEVKLGTGLNLLTLPATVNLFLLTAFPDFAEFKKHTNDIAWDTEVWIMEFPEHMIHFNGDRFLGPR